MANHQETIDFLTKHLINLNIPEKSIIHEWQVGRGRVDIAVVDSDTNIIVALFEVKVTSDPDWKIRGKKQLKQYAENIGNLGIPAYLAHEKSESPFVSIYRVDLQTDEIVELEKDQNLSYINFNSFLSRGRTNLLLTNKQERQDINNVLWVVSWALGIGVSVLFYLDITERIKISPTELTLLALASALFLIPFVGKLKFLGIEYTALISKDEEH